jgi:hypothetical protein
MGGEGGPFIFIMIQASFNENRKTNDMHIILGACGNSLRYDFSILMEASCSAGSGLHTAHYVWYLK